MSKPDPAVVKSSQRQRVFELLGDQLWHTHRSLSAKTVGGNRYSARILELKRMGYDIEDRPLDDGSMGNEYRLTSLKPGTPKPKLVKIFMEEDDVQHLLTQPLKSRTRGALSKALKSFKANKSRL